MTTMTMRTRLAIMSYAGRLGGEPHDSPARAEWASRICDLRAALNLARGVPAEHITSLGYPDLAWAVREARTAPYA